MPKIPGIHQRDAVRVFEKLGYRIARQSGHIVMTNGKSRIVIPRHNPINAITMGSIARTAGLIPFNNDFRYNLDLRSVCLSVHPVVDEGQGPALVLPEGPQGVSERVLQSVQCRKHAIAQAVLHLIP